MPICCQTRSIHSYISFKGKGRNLLAANIKDAEIKLTELNQQAAEIKNNMHTLIRRLNATYDNALPVRLVTCSRGLMWRLKASKAAEQYFFTFASERAGEFLRNVPTLTKQQLCEYEKQRAYLQLQRRLITYQIRALNEYVAHVRAANYLRRSFCL